jgi:hypothetical protein
MRCTEMRGRRLFTRQDEIDEGLPQLRVSALRALTSEDRLVSDLPRRERQDRGLCARSRDGRRERCRRQDVAVVGDAMLLAVASAFGPP